MHHMIEKRMIVEVLESITCDMCGATYILDSLEPDDKEVISICPEVLAGMETPRPCAEIVNGRVVDENGNDVSLEYNKAVAVALSKIQNEEIDLVILQSRSPTCGVNQIYDGSFTGKLVSGMGLFAKALKQKGYHVIDVEEI